MKWAADEYEGRVQVLIILSGVIPVKFFRFSAVHGEEVGARVIGPQRVEEFFEGGMEAGSGRQLRLAATAAQ